MSTGIFVLTTREPGQEKRQNAWFHHFLPPIVSKTFRSAYQMIVRFKGCPLTFGAIPKAAVRSVHQVVNIVGSAVHNLHIGAPLSEVNSIPFRGEVNSASDLSLSKSGVSSLHPAGGECPAVQLVHFRIDQLASSLSSYSVPSSA